MSALPPASAATPEEIFAKWRADTRRAVGLEAREVELDDGLRYSYLEGGHGEPLVLLHGFGANKDNFLSVAAKLASHYRLIVPDHIGFGDSTCHPDLDYRPAAQAERLNRLMTTLGVTRVHVAGSSMGGHVAMAWAARFPAQVQSLWLLCPAGAWSAPPGAAMAQVNEGINPLVPDSIEAFQHLSQIVMRKPMPLPEPFARVIAMDRLARLPLERIVFEHVRSDPIEPHIEGLATPTLIVWGRHDQILNPAGADILHGLLPRSRVVMMDDVGHLPAVEAPGEVVREYLAFRRGLAGA
jgi:pimeloyl-ACP methyl ester carboxylesterase